VKRASESPVARPRQPAALVRPSRILYLFYFLLALTLICFPKDSWSRAQSKSPAPLKQDEECMACHGQPGMTSATGKSISINPAKHAASVHGILGCQDCHQTIKDYPHPARVAKVKPQASDHRTSSTCARILPAEPFVRRQYLLHNPPEPTRKYAGRQLQAFLRVRARQEADARCGGRSWC
jgi:hypothetical protein